MLGIAKNRAIPCLSCGYDITGLGREGVCPECASPLKSTLEASIFLRSLPKTVVQRIDRGLFVLSCTPLALSLGVALGFVLMIGFALFSQVNLEVGWLTGLGLGCVLAIGCFALGAFQLTSPIPGRALGPTWARNTVRYVAPAGALIIAMFSSLPLLSYGISTLLTMIGRGTCQVLSLLVLSAVLTLLQAIERQTQAGREARGRYWYGWGLLTLLGALWFLLYWFDPIRLGPAGLVLGGGWGGFLLAGTMILQVGVFWGAVESVALEWFAVTSTEPQ